MKNIEKICSYCGKEEPTVNRDMFDGLCADCTDKALNSDSIGKEGKKNNKKLKSGYMPYMCPCESTRFMSMCGEETCDGIYYWIKD